MTLELTKDEFNRLRNSLAIASRIGNQRGQLSSQKEAEILQAIRENWSNVEIKRKFRTSDFTITRIKKQYGLWGV